MKKIGFTLIEVAVSLGIIGIIGAGGIFIYLTVIQSANRASSTVEVDGIANLIMETMVREIRSAGCVNGDPDPTILYILDSQCSTPELVTFRRVADGEYYNIVREPTGGTSSTLNPSSVTITNLSFLEGSDQVTTSSDVVQITLSVAIRNPVRSDYEASVTLSETVALRRY